MSPLKKSFWRSVESKSGDEKSQSFLHQEFTEGAAYLEDGVSRRNFIKLMGSSAALAGLTGCNIRRPVQKILPYGRRPEDVVPGKPKYYATTHVLGEEVTGILVESHEGRPTKIEGNPDHPRSLGAASLFQQASILNLYDPDRLKHVSNKGSKSSIQEFKAWIDDQLKKSNGEGLSILTETQVSPSFYRLVSQLKQKYPKIDTYRYDPVNRDNSIEGIRLVTGQPLTPDFNYDKADVIVSFACDFLGQEMDQILSTKQFTKRRDPDKNMNRLYMFETHYSLTGAKADHRFALKPSDIEKVLWSLANELISRGSFRVPAEFKSLISNGVLMSQSVLDKSAIQSLANDLLKHKGKSLIVAGASQSETIHGLVYILNDLLKSQNNTITYRPQNFSSFKLIQRSNRHSIQTLSSEMKKKTVKTLLVIGGNPVLNAPQDTQFGETIENVENVVHLSHEQNETSNAAGWVIPRTHYLESWGDAKGIDGSVSLIQPLIRPMYKSISDLEFMSLLINKKASGYQIVRQTWRSNPQFTSSWKTWLHNGSVSSSTRGLFIPNSINQKFISQLKANLVTTDTGLEVNFIHSSQTYDGRFVNNGWLQETPDPVTKLTWDNAVLVSPKKAKFYGLKMGQMVTLSNKKSSLTLPVYILPGHAVEAVTLVAGFGRTEAGRVGENKGFDVYPMRTSDNFDWAPSITLTPTKKFYPLASTQDHGQLEGRPIYRETTLKNYKKHPTFAQEMVETPPLKSLWDEKKYTEGNQWGMSIDLSKCTGCQACVVGCQSENNIPIVGKDEVLNGREMHWIRIDRYFEGHEDNPKVYHQPMTCLHCENAPCEQVCPVAATTHSEDGLNDMAYNRCVGTRYCADNCPTKVRRFNYFDYHQRNPQSAPKDKQHLFDYFREPEKSVQMQFNPDVTVRMRGVMEKCTFCVQRIRKLSIVAKNENRKLQDGEVVTACQQTCPADAISFGDILDKESKVSKQKNKNRNYVILKQLHLKARTSYIANVRNPNTSISKANHQKNGDSHGH